jgi:hypothetical protein
MIPLQMIKGLLLFASGAVTGVFVAQNYPLPNLRTSVQQLVDSGSSNKPAAEPEKKDNKK